MTIASLPAPVLQPRGDKERARALNSPIAAAILDCLVDYIEGGGGISQFHGLLALIVEKKTGLSFRAAIEQLIFRPLNLTASGVDDESMVHTAHMAKGDGPLGTYEVKPAPLIHRSAQTGNASAFTTARDEPWWVDALFHGHLWRSSSRDAVLDTSVGVGYGWFKSQNQRFGETVYSRNGRAPGFASFVLYLPHSQTTVVALSNIYSSATTTIE